MAGATEVLISSANRLALMHELRGEPEWTLARCCEKLSPVDLVLVEGFKRETHPKLEVYRAAVGKPPLHPEDPNIVAVASDGAGRRQACRWCRSTTSRRWPTFWSRRPRRSIPSSRGCGAPDGAAHRRLLRVRRAVARDRRGRAADRASASTPVAETEIVALKDARGRVLAADVIAPIDLPPFDNSAVDGYAVRHADLGAKDETTLAIVDRLTAGRAAAHSVGAGEAIRIFTGAPMPAGADTVFMQEDVRAEGGAVVVPPGLKRGANRAARRRGCADGLGRAARGPPPAAAGSEHGGGARTARRCRCGGACASRSSPPATRSSSRARRSPPPDSTTRTASCSARLLAQLGAAVSDLGILRDDPEKLAARLAEAAQGHDLVLTSGGVSTGEADYVTRRDRRGGSLVFWRVAIKPGRPVAMGVLRGHGVRRPAGQSGRGVRDLRARGAAAAAAACRRRA